MSNHYSVLREETNARDSKDVTAFTNIKSLGEEEFSNSNRSKSDSSMLMTPLNSQTRSRSPSPSRPLLRGDNTNPGAPLAKIETDDDVDEREVVNKPYPGVDDGFFSNGNTLGGTTNNQIPTTQDSGEPDAEWIPIQPKEPGNIDHHIPGITPRLGGDGDSEGQQPPAEIPKQPAPAPQPEFPQPPGFRPWGWDLEVGNTLPSGETIPDLNVYQHKKTLAQGMMDLALFSANANQLRYVLETFKSHPYYYPSIVLISISLLLQVAVGVGLIWNATYNVKDQKALCIANKVNNVTTICVFFVTVINVFISAFGVAPAPN